jgi:hypothetical protein
MRTESRLETMLKYAMELSSIFAKVGLQVTQLGCRPAARLGRGGTWCRP